MGQSNYMRLSKGRIFQAEVRGSCNISGFEDKRRGAYCQGMWMASRIFPQSLQKEHNLTLVVIYYDVNRKLIQAPTGTANSSSYLLIASPFHILSMLLAEPTKSLSGAF